MSISKTVFGIFAMILLGASTLIASARRPELKNKWVELTKKKSVAQKGENLFI
ncbi:MAG: hypothetical protein ACO2ZZ_02475 [Cyclobacteriaceae bacterium]|jgi:hypothetical protein